MGTYVTTNPYLFLESHGYRVQVPLWVMCWLHTKYQYLVTYTYPVGVTAHTTTYLTADYCIHLRFLTIGIANPSPKKSGPIWRYLSKNCKQGSMPCKQQSDILTQLVSKASLLPEKNYFWFLPEERITLMFVRIIKFMLYLLCRIIKFMLYLLCFSCLCTLFQRISDSPFTLIHNF